MIRISDFGRTVSKMVVQDSIIIRDELEIINNLWQQFILEKVNNRTLETKIRRLIEVGLNGSRSCISVDMLQRLLWRLESNQVVLNDQIIQNISSSWLMFVFQNSFTEFANVNTSLEHIFNGFKQEKVAVSILISNYRKVLVAH